MEGNTCVIKRNSNGKYDVTIRGVTKKRDIPFSEVVYFLEMAMYLPEGSHDE